MMTKPRPETRYLSFAAAAAKFSDVDDVLALLQEGTLTARGRNVDYGGLTSGNVYDIGMEAWRDFEFERDGLHLHNSEGQHYIAQIELLRARVDEVSTIKPLRDKGGRPPKYDWPAFWKQMLVHLHCNGLPEGNTLEAWLDQALEFVVKLGDGFGFFA